MKKLKDIFGGDTRQFGMIFALVALIVLFQIMTGGLVLKPENVINIFNGNSYILVMAIGMVVKATTLPRHGGVSRMNRGGRRSTSTTAQTGPVHRDLPHPPAQFSCTWQPCLCMVRHVGAIALRLEVPHGRSLH